MAPAAAFNPAICGVSESDWMSLLPNNWLLSQMSIPGTHDTMTYVGGYSDYQLGPLDAVKIHARTQTMSLSEQLDAGIRFIDIRPGYQYGSNDLGIVHGRVYLFHEPADNFDEAVVKFSEVVSTCESFLAQHSNETIVMKVKPDTDIPNIYPGDATLAGIVRNYATAAGHDNRWYTGSTVPKLGDVRGKIVLVRQYADITYKLGIPWEGTAIPFGNGGTGSFSVQDNYNVPNAPTFASAVETKWGHINTHLDTTLATSVDENKWFVNFTSASADGGGQIVLGYSPAAYAKMGVGQSNPSDLVLIQDTIPINNRTYNQLQFNAPQRRVGTILMDFPERMNAYLSINSTFYGPNRILIDQVIGYNWPFVTVASSQLATGATTQVTFHSLDGLTENPTFHLDPGSITTAFGPVAHTFNGFHNYTSTFTAPGTGGLYTVGATFNYTYYFVGTPLLSINLEVGAPKPAVKAIVPITASLRVNDGSAQRSKVTSLTVTFSRPVTLSAGALEIRAGSTSFFPTDLTVVGNQVTIRFTGMAGLIGGSLGDGNYTLIEHKAHITGGPYSEMFTDFSQNFHRLFGDVNGDARVDAIDAAVMSAIANGTRRGYSPLYLDYLDYNGNGIISTEDRDQFNARFGRSL